MLDFQLSTVIFTVLNLLIGCALAEGTAIFGFITALLILFMK